MEDFEDLDLEKIKFDHKNLKEGGVSLRTRILLRLWPIKGMEFLAKELGMDSEIMEKADRLFYGADRVDIVPSTSGARGFQIVLDQRTALYFVQDGDRFVYDGCEEGEYEKGTVTVFDN